MEEHYKLRDWIYKKKKNKEFRFRKVMFKSVCNWLY